MNHALPSLARRSILAVLLVGLAFTIATSGTSRNLSPKERVEVFEKVWKEVDEHYYDPEFGGVNWQEVHQRYLPLVQAAKDDKDFYSIVDRMTAELHDAHTRFSSPEQWENHKKHQGVSIGFRPGYQSVSRGVRRFELSCCCRPLGPARIWYRGRILFAWAGLGRRHLSE